MSMVIHGRVGIVNQDLLLAWPLLIVIEDCYVPESAPDVIKVCDEYESEILGLVLHFAAMKAQESWTVN